MGIINPIEVANKALHENCPVQSFFWSVFPRIWTEYWKIQTRKNSVFEQFLHSEQYVNT